MFCPFSTLCVPETDPLEQSCLFSYACLTPYILRVGRFTHWECGFGPMGGHHCGQRGACPSLQRDPESRALAALTCVLGPESTVSGTDVNGVTWCIGFCVLASLCS